MDVEREVLYEIILAQGCWEDIKSRVIEANWMS